MRPIYPSETSDLSEKPLSEMSDLPIRHRTAGQFGHSNQTTPVEEEK